MPAREWRCSQCGACYPLDVPRYLCSCDGRLELDVSAVGRDAVVDTENTLWRYRALLPLADPGTPFAAGWTPLVRHDGLAAEFGAGELWIKDETANPTGSLKDRASALVVAAALASGQEVIAAASTGNAATALAGAAAAAGVPSVVFVPATVTASRVARLTGLGAHVIVVDGDYDTAVSLSLAACDEWGWYCRTTAVNPYTTQGKKTAALEIAEQLGWQAPDVVVVSVGDGNILVGLYHGFRDARRLGWIDRMPRLIGVQAAGAPAIHRAWSAGETEVAPIPGDTVAAGISVGVPMDGTRALAALRDTGGLAVTVDDDEILAMAALLAKRGVGAEPSSAAAFTALPRLIARDAIDPAERIVVVNTGNNVSTESERPVTTPVVKPVLSAVRAALPGALFRARDQDEPASTAEAGG